MISHIGTLHGFLGPSWHRYKACSAKTRKSCLHIWQFSPLLSLRHFAQCTITIFIFLHLTSSQGLEFPESRPQLVACNQIAMKAKKSCRNYIEFTEWNCFSNMVLTSGSSLNFGFFSTCFVCWKLTLDKNELIDDLAQRKRFV